MEGSDPEEALKGNVRIHDMDNSFFTMEIQCGDVECFCPKAVYTNTTMAGVAQGLKNPTTKMCYGQVASLIRQKHQVELIKTLTYFN